jgi:small-conductance mechanosensitive channel
MKTKSLFVLTVAAFLVIGTVATEVHSQSQEDQAAVSKEEPPVTVPKLADIIPLSTELSGRLAALEKEVEAVPDFSALEGKYTKIEDNLEDFAAQLERFRDLRSYRFYRFAMVRESIERDSKLFLETSKPLRQDISNLSTSREKWLAEKKSWSEWQTSLLKEGTPDQIKSTFSKANSTIDTALKLIDERLEMMLRMQDKTSNIQVKINSLIADLDNIILVRKRGVLPGTSAPMFSAEYFSQFKSRLFDEMKKDLANIIWPGSRFFAQKGWVVLLQGFLSIVLIIIVYQNRQLLNKSKRWRFIAARPFSAGLFLGYFSITLIYQYIGAPITWLVACSFIGWVCFVRLLSAFLEASWKRQFIYGLIILLMVTRLMDVFSFPLVLFRIYILLSAFAGIFFCLHFAAKSVRDKKAGLYPWLLRFVSLIFAVVIIVELWGKEALALYLFLSLLDSASTAIAFMFLLYMIHGGLEWLFLASPLRRAAVLQADDTKVIIRRVRFFVDAVIVGLVLLPLILVSWGVYDSQERAIEGLLELGFNLGSVRISLGLLIISVCIVYGSFLVSWIFQKLLIDKVLVKFRVEQGARYSMARLINYVIIGIGFLIALSTLGFELTRITIILGALGIGIGFGLQSIVNNFVSGLILLFERPVRVGDSVQIGEKWSKIKKIGLRATTVETFEKADVIIPNADLVNNQVTNWTLSNRQVRLRILVGVIYGSDVGLVMEKLMTCAKANPKVVSEPAPQVLFLSFGDSSLDFELRVWIVDADYRLIVKSELHQEIDRSFREAKIVIAFPQRDLHLRSMDESVVLRPPSS